MTFHVNDAGTWKQMTAGFIKDNGIWKPIKELWTRDGGVWKKAYQNLVELVQTANEAHVYLRDKVAAAVPSWNGTDPIKVFYTIAAGVWLYSTPGNWALNLRGFPAGSEITVINNGYIAGMGGAGGNGGSWDGAGAAGQQGGHGLLISEGGYDQAVYNYAYIWGGGGGGGGGGGARAYQNAAVLQGDCYAGGGGGGGGYGAIAQIAAPGSATYNYSSSTQAQIVEARQRNVQNGNGNSGGAGANVARINSSGGQTFAEATGGAGGNGGGYGQYGASGGSGAAYVSNPGTAGSFGDPKAGGAGGPPGNWVYNRDRASWPTGGYGDARGLTHTS